MATLANSYLSSEALPAEFLLHNDLVMRRVTLYQFNLYMEDYSPIAIREAFGLWKTTSIGEWCMEHAHDMGCRQYRDMVVDSYEITIYGYMEEKHYMWFLLNK